LEIYFKERDDSDMDYEFAAKYLETNFKIWYDKRNAKKT
jgi:hypothetical protein